jgi:hypothetical protein
MGEQATNIISFPRPPPRRSRPTPRGPRQQRLSLDGVWRRRRVVLTDETSDAMDEGTWAQGLHRWTRRRPQRRS